MLAGWVAATHHPGVLLHTGALRKGGLSPGVQLTLLWLPQPFCRAEKLCAGLSPGVSYAQPRWVSAQSPPQPAANPSRVPARLRREPGLRQSSAGTGEAGRGDLQQFHLTGAALRSPSDESRHIPGSDVLCPQAPCCPASTVLAALALLAGSPPLAPQYFDSISRTDSSSHLSSHSSSCSAPYATAHVAGLWFPSGPSTRRFLRLRAQMKFL